MRSFLALAAVCGILIGGRSSARQEDEAAAARPAPAVEEPVAPRAPTPGEKAIVELLSGLGVRYVPEKERVEVDGWVNMQAGLIEVFACAPGGKTHESVIVLDCVPRGLHAGLLALGLEPGSPAEMGTDGSYRPPTGDRVEIEVHWTDEAGKPRQARAEDWIWDQVESASMPRGAWIFAGSLHQPVPGSKRRTSYVADGVKSLVTTYHDASSILENPLAEGIDDTVYYANEKVVPPVSTKVTAVFRCAPKQEDKGK